MPDARLPDRWMNNIDMLALSVDEWYIFTHGLMWSNNQLTDGHIPVAALRLLHPDGVKEECYANLVQLGLWEKVTDGYRYPSWGDDMGQTTAERFNSQREGSKLRQRRKRERAREGVESEPVTLSVTRDVQGKDRQGKVKTIPPEQSDGEEVKPVTVDEVEAVAVPDSSLLGKVSAIREELRGSSPASAPVTQSRADLEAVGAHLREKYVGVQ